MEAIAERRPHRTGTARKTRAGNRTRTGDPHLGKVVLYQLSYSRMWATTVDEAGFPVNRCYLSGPRGPRVPSARAPLRPGCAVLRSRTTVFVLSLLLLGQPLADAAAQEPWSPLVPRGHLRLGLLGRYLSFGEVHELAGLGERPALLASRFSGAVDSRIFPLLASSEAAVRSAAGDPELALSLGEMTSVLERSDVRVPLALDAGVFDWLTVGAVVPLVQNEAEFATTFAASGHANAGFSPGIDDPALVSGFLGGLDGAIGEYDGFRGGRCAEDPTSQACRDATERLGDARTFRQLLAAMYGGLFAPLQGSRAGTALESRLAEFAALFQAAGIAVPSGALPLAGGALARDDIAALIGDPRFGVEATHGFGSWRSLWRLGDVEVRANARLIERGGPEEDHRLAAGIGAMARLPTGEQDDPGNFLDAGSGDRQLDIEMRGWVNGRWGRSFGLWADARYGVQMTGSTARRVFDPATTFAPRATETTLDWTPGNYLAVELAPWYRLAEPVALIGGYRFFRKGEDAFAVAAVVVAQEEAAGGGVEGLSGGAAAPTRGAVAAGGDRAARGAADPSILVAGSGASLGELLIGMVYDRTGAEEGGERGRPLEIRAIYRRAMGGSGATPVGQSLEVGFRFFARIW